MLQFLRSMFGASIDSSRERCRNETRVLSLTAFLPVNFRSLSRLLREKR
jgi:hypothetical protein